MLAQLLKVIPVLRKNSLDNKNENADSESESSSSLDEDSQDSRSTARRYPERQRTKPKRLSEFTAVCHGECVDIPEASTCHSNPTVELDSPTLKQALNSNEKEFWLQAINEELEWLTEANTWEQVDHPAGARVSPSKFVLKKKRDSSGIVEW
jgi:hypothetical protein